MFLPKQPAVAACSESSALELASVSELRRRRSSDASSADAWPKSACCVKTRIRVPRDRPPFLLPANLGLGRLFRSRSRCRSSTSSRRLALLTFFFTSANKSRCMCESRATISRNTFAPSSVLPDVFLECSFLMLALIPSQSTLSRKSNLCSSSLNSSFSRQMLHLHLVLEDDIKDKGRPDLAWREQVLFQHIIDSAL